MKGFTRSVRPLALAIAALLSLTACTKEAWRSSNKVDEHPLSKFGRKAEIDEAKKWDDYGSAAAEGKPGFLGGIGGGVGGVAVRTKDDIRADKLYAGALEVVMELPITIADRPGGFLSTDWKVDPNSPDLRYRLNIRVSGQEPYGEVKVVVLRQQRQEGEVWADMDADSKLAAQIEKAIRKRAQVAKH